MKNKNGFTLVELLAVIAILAILVIIALPNVMGMFNTAKENSFKTEIKEVFKTAQQTWMQDSMYSTGEVVYSRCKNGCTGKSLDLSGRSDLEYYIKINKAGQVVEYYATDGTFQYGYDDGDLKIENINSVEKIADLDSDDVIAIGNYNNVSKFCISSHDGSNQIEFDYEDGMTWIDYVNSRYFNASDWPYFPNAFYDKSTGIGDYISRSLYGDYGYVPMETIRSSSVGCYVELPS